MCTVQFIGSMQTWAAKGNSYTASTFFVAELRAASASPSLRTAFPGFAAFSMKCLRSDSLDSSAFGPSSQVTFRSLRPAMAAQELLARTTTPPEVNAPSPTASMVITSRTPGTALVLVASNLATLPPNTGQRAMTAYSMPGMRESMPNFAAPVDFGSSFETVAIVADNGEVVGILERNRVEVGDGQFGCVAGELAVGKELFARA